MASLEQKAHSQATPPASRWGEVGTSRSALLSARGTRRGLCSPCHPGLPGPFPPTSTSTPVILLSCWPAEQLQTQLWGQTDSGSHLGFASCIVTLSSKSEVFRSVNMTRAEPFPRPDFSFELRKCSDCCHLHLHLPRHQLRKADVVTPISETRTRRLCGATSSESRISRLSGGAGCPSCHLDAPPRSPRALPRPSQPPPLPVPLRLAWSVSATGTGRVPGTLRSAVMRKVCGLQLTSVTPGKRESTVWQRPRGDLESKPGSVTPL